MNNVEKSLLRKKIIKIRTSLNPFDMQEKSQKIITQLFLLSQYKNSKVMLIYIPFKNEIDTIPIIKKGWQDGKKVLVPVCQPDKNLLLSELHSLEELKIGKLGLYEPALEYQRPIPPEKADLAILPGIAFDLQGYRLGYGGGYFDRFFNRHYSSCTKVALAYDFQILEKLPIEEHDLKVDIILTESNTYYLN